MIAVAALAASVGRITVKTLFALDPVCQRLVAIQAFAGERIRADGVAGRTLGQPLISSVGLGQFARR